MTPIRALVSRFIEKETHLDSVFKTLTFIIIIRVFLEMLLERRHSLRFSPDYYVNLIGYIHMYVFWLCVFSAIIILAVAILRLKYMEALRLVLLFSPLILIPPIIDFVSTRGEGGLILYSFKTGTFLFNFLNFFNPLVEIETVSRGARIEVLAAFLSAFYVSYYILGRGLLRSLLLSFSIYTVVFLFGYLPALYLVAGVDVYGLSGEAVSGITKSQKFLFMYLLPVILLLGATMGILYKENRENLAIAIAFLYPGRLLFYLMLLSFGFLFVSHEVCVYPKVPYLEDAMVLTSAVLSITFLFVYAKILNDIYDLKIDRVSNSGRPLVKGAVSVENAHRLKVILLVLSLVFSLASERSFIFYWLFIWAASHIYSVPPLRVRRYYPAGHLTLSLIGTSVFLAGGALVKSYDVYSALRQKEILAYIFSAFFFLSHVKDFKDIEGDRAGHVQNVLNYIKFPKAMGMIYLSGFTLSLYLITGVLDALNRATLAGHLLFYAWSVYYTVTVRDTRRLDRLLLFALVFSLYVTGIWIYLIPT